MLILMSNCFLNYSKLYYVCLHWCWSFLKVWIRRLWGEKLDDGPTHQRRRRGHDEPEAADNESIAWSPREPQRDQLRVSLRAILCFSGDRCLSTWLGEWKFWVVHITKSRMDHLFKAYGLNRCKDKRTKKNMWLGSKNLPTPLQLLIAPPKAFWRPP